MSAHLPNERRSPALVQAQRILAAPEFNWGEATAAGKLASRRRADLIIHSAGIAPGQSVLELGCGTGFFSEQFSRTGTRLACIDLSREYLNKARDRQLQSAGFFQADAAALPFPDAVFDAVVGARILHHLTLERTLPELRRVLRPGGRLAFCEPNMLNPQLLVQKNIPWIKRLMGDTPDETAFFRWRLRRVLDDHGFQQISIVPFDFLHPWTAAFMISFVSALGHLLEAVPVVREIAGSLMISAARGDAAIAK